MATKYTYSKADIPLEVSEPREETEEERREEAADRELEVPVGDQFAFADKIINLEGKAIDAGFFNKDFISGKLTVFEKQYIDENVELAQLCKQYGAAAFINFLAVNRNARSMTSKALNGWLLETLISTTVKKEISKIDYNAKPQQQQGSPLQNLGGMFNKRQ